MWMDKTFQSTPLMRGETSSTAVQPSPLTFQSTPLMRGETQRLIAKTVKRQFQSTPLMRGETAINSAYQPLDEFQSTPLMRGETSLRAPRFAERSYFNPLPSCEGRRGISTLISVTCISIHSPHARGDNSRALSEQDGYYFNPLPSCEGRLDTFRAIWS